MVTLKEKTSEVIADKDFGKAIQDYGEKSRRNVLVVTEFENRALGFGLECRTKLN